MAFHLYCKKHDNLPENQKWCGVIIQINDDSTGAVVDATLEPTCDRLTEWFTDWIKNNPA